MKTIHMPKELAIKWLNALRSGHYTQGTGKLFQHNPACEPHFAFCVLGVLKYVTEGDDFNLDNPEREDEFDLEWLEYHGITFNSFYRLGGELRGQVNPEPETAPQVDYNGVREFIFSFNDGRDGCPMLGFNELANLIEKHLEVID